MGKLALGRRVGDRVRIEVPTSDGVRYVWVELAEIRGGRVRLAFEADQDIIFLRGELLTEEAA